MIDKERHAKITEQRRNFAYERLTTLTEVDIIEVVEDHITFKFKNEKVTLYPYTGWFTGKSVKDGRGITELLAQLRK